ncbi:hypothetical protein BJ742DRAFT_109669 [Cladochytrium replicatum]|nr:hypothetical protein BJ742DRAFT_109669 [Cladochytrium replicatum]
MASYRGSTSSLFMARHQTQYLWTPRGPLRPGTASLMEQNLQPIMVRVSFERLTEGTSILTEASAGRYGIASDEDVATPSVDAKTPLVGFNNEGVFASLGHIFLTTTGPRPLEPLIAMQENTHQRIAFL